MCVCVCVCVCVCFASQKTCSPLSVQMDMMHKTNVSVERWRPNSLTQNPKKTAETVQIVR
jgi:hypothetical protein